MMAAYYHASRMFQSKPCPPPNDLQPIVDKTAEYVAKNGDHFERTLILKHILDSRFEFLHPWNEYNAYYKAKITDTRQKMQKEIEDAMPARTQRLQSGGSVSFKVTTKPKTQLNIGTITDEDDEESEDTPATDGKRQCEQTETRSDIKRLKMSDKDTTFKVCSANY